MKPTIMVGDHFFLDKVAFPGNFPEKVRPWLPRRQIQRGDIIAFRPPATVEPKTPFVKRVIAVGGDTIEIRGKIVILNGEAVDEPYKIHTDPTVYNSDQGFGAQQSIDRDNYGPITVPEDSFFVMGDNRDNSNDSRYWGFVSRDSVIGKPLFVYWSYESDPYIGGELSWEERGREFLSMAVHFFSKTRWFRMGTIVD
jgi:signal peptidase I